MLIQNKQHLLFLRYRSALGNLKEDSHQKCRLNNVYGCSQSHLFQPSKNKLKFFEGAWQMSLFHNNSCSPALFEGALAEFITLFSFAISYHTWVFFHWTPSKVTVPSDQNMRKSQTYFTPPERCTGTCPRNITC